MQGSTVLDHVLRSAKHEVRATALVGIHRVQQANIRQATNHTGVGVSRQEGFIRPYHLLFSMLGVREVVTETIARLPRLRLQERRIHSIGVWLLGGSLWWPRGSAMLITHHANRANLNTRELLGARPCGARDLLPARALPL